MKKAISATLLLCSVACFAAEFHGDVEFAKPDGVSLTLDASIPEGAGPFPAVILVHGGAFIKGDKQSYIKPMFEPLTRAGLAWFTINYRLAPKYRYPAAVEDVEAAIRWVRKNAAAYRVDPERIALVGESAGGYLVSKAGSRAKGATKLAGVVAFYAVYDPVRELQPGRAGEEILANRRTFFAVEELNEETRKRLLEAAPLHNVHRDMPAYLLVHGTKDPLVPYESSVKMCERMKAIGAQCELYAVEGGGHGMSGWKQDPQWQDVCCQVAARAVARAVASAIVSNRLCERGFGFVSH